MKETKMKKDKLLKRITQVLNMNNNKQNGITLIALIVTIIALLLLAGIGISMLTGDNGILNKTVETQFKTEMSEYNESVKLYTSAALINKEDVSKINAGYEDSELTLTEIIPNFKANTYGNKVMIVSGELYYLMPEVQFRTARIKQEIQWCKDIGVKTCTDKVELYEDYETVEAPSSMWVTVDGVSYYSPDVRKFNPKNTYYVDNSGSIVGRVDRINAPSSWYNYKNQEWANIVTVNGNNVAYWVWIPRYEYKLDSEHQKSDIKFIQIGQKDEGYEVPESFTFGSQEEGATQTELTGFWISKYELSENTNTGFEVDVSGSNPTIKNLTTVGEYKIFVDGKYKQTNEITEANKDIVITGLKKDIMYNIMLVGPDMQPVGEQNICSLSDEIEPPELTNLNPQSTYYVDSSGKVTGRIDKVNQPDDWYDYNNQKWANIVTVTDNKVAYWVWIPRYEYKLSNADQKADIKFIPKTQVKANSGYEIPESFAFGGKQLAGFWISKYELSESTGQVLNCVVGTNSIEIQKFSEDDDKEYSFFVNGQEYNNGASTTLPGTISGLSAGTTYNIMVIDKTTGQPVLEKDVATNPNNIEEPDLSRGFNIEKTYLVIYSNDGNAIVENEVLLKDVLKNGYKTNATNPELLVNGEIDKSKLQAQIGENEWYDYSNKKWANMKVVNDLGDEDETNDLISYWVWIPRYEYKLYSQSQKSTIKYISKNQTTPDSGYEIPESFTFGGKQLGGFWISKYELSEK